MYNFTKSGSHQYTLINRTLELRKSIVKYHSRQYDNLDPSKNILVTAGASAALYCLFLTTLGPGDEVILF
jgi:aspartate/methionine/tyrosine aminotransferase